MCRDVFAAALLILSLSARAELVDRIVAVVNDDAITQSDVQHFKHDLKNHGLLDQGLLSLYDISKLQTDDKAVMNFLIDQNLIDDEVKKQGIITPIEQVDSEIGSIAQGKGLSLDDLKNALKAQGVTYAKYQDFIRTSMERQTLLQKEVSSKIKISDDQINAFYSSQKHVKNPLVFEYTLSHIFFADSNGGADAAKLRAEDVKKKLDEGLPFDTLVSQYSEDKEYSQNGGSFGTFRLSDLNPQLRQVLAPLSAGDVSSVVQMPDGFHIFKVVKKVLVPSPDLEAKREEIRRYLTSVEFKRQFHAWLAKKRAESFIHFHDQKAS